MTPKANSKVAASKKESPKKAVAGAKTEKKKEAKAPVEMPEITQPMVDPDELEEREEEAEAAAAASANQSGNAAALAAAAGPTEISASFKNFRHHPDMENFYRFIYENDLRHEALCIIDEIMTDKQQRRAAAPTKPVKGSSPH